MDWLAWALGIGGLLVVFVLWDIIFCGGKRCKELIDRLEPPTR